MASTPTTPSKPAKPLPSDDIVELRPPDGSGFGGTVKYYRADAEAIAMLKARGYVVVDEKDPAA